MVVLAATFTAGALATETATFYDNMKLPFLPDRTTACEALAPPHLPQDKNSLRVRWKWTKSEPRILRRDTHHAGIQGEYLAANR